MFSRNDAKKIDEFLHNNFPQIYKLKLNKIILLYGGSIKSIIMNNKAQDLDFLILNGQKADIENFIKRNSLEYCHNAFGGYKIIYNNLKVDMAFYDDLYLSGHLSTDFLFYDVFRKQIIPFGFKNTEELNVIFDYYDQGFFNTNRRIRKAKKSMAQNICNNYKKKHYYCRICQFITTLYFKGIKIAKKNFRKLEARACFRKKTLKK